jgi:ADP-heptose:LPS heptosyltransferase
MKKILVIRFSSIGDIVLTTPVVRCLKHTFPEAEIHYLTKKRFEQILAPNPYINKLHLLEDNLQEVIGRLRQEHFDYVVDLHHNLRTLIVKTALMKPSSSYNKLNMEKWLLVQFKVNRLPPVHIVDRYMATVAGLGVKNDGRGLDYFIAPEQRVDIRNDLPEAFHGGYIAWAIGGQQFTKRYPAHKIIETLTQADPSMPVVFLGGKEDVHLAEEVLELVKDRPLYNACGRLSLGQSASLAEQARLVISNDTGLMHIAAAFKKPLISIWGNTVPEMGMSPYTGNAAGLIPQYVAEVPMAELSCRPCSKLGFGACPKGHFKCMNDIDSAAIAAKIEAVYKG